MPNKSASADQRLAEIAARQHGIVTAAQLSGLGLARSSVTERVRAGRLHRIHQGVYAVGHAGLSREGRYMAAVLALGDGAVLSHQSAVVLWGLLPPSKIEQAPVHVSLPSPDGRRRRAGIVVHRTRFAPGDLTRHAEIPVTSPNRTILDVRRTLEDPKLVRQAIGEAQHRRYRLDPRLKADRTRSDLEKDFRAFVRRHRLPRAEINVRVGPFSVDFLWRAQRLVVETDSYEYHHGLIAFEDDHERDLKLRSRGLTVLRYTGRQLEREPAAIAAEIRDRLAAPS